LRRRPSHDGAKAAERAADQGRYWAMHDLLYTRRDEWTKPRNPKDSLHAYAGELGLDSLPPSFSPSGGDVGHARRQSSSDPVGQTN